MLDVHHHSQAEIANQSVDDVLRKLRAQTFLGLTNRQILNYLLAAKADVLAVDVASLDDETLLIEFITKGRMLIEAIKQLKIT